MNAFGSVSFPDHCGLHAAVAKDDWIQDDKILREITKDKDFNGEWWDVPKDHLLKCMMALSYLDDLGMEYYLPAYMKSIIEIPFEYDKSGIYSRSWQIIFSFVPPDESDYVLHDHFQSQFKQINGIKKQSCRDFLYYIRNCKLYSDEAQQLAEEGLSNVYWTNNS